MHESFELVPQIAFRAELMNLPELDRRLDCYIDLYRGVIEDTANLTTIMKPIHGSIFSDK